MSDAKRFLLFSGDYYDPEGGAFDLAGAFPTLEAAEAAGRAELSDSTEWSHVLDMDTDRIVAEGEYEVLPRWLMGTGVQESETPRVWWHRCEDEDE